MSSTPSSSSSLGFSSFSYTSSNTSNSFSSASFLTDSDTSARRNPLRDLRTLLDHLYHNRVPGPYLIRVKQEFNLCTGEGGEGTVYEASSDFALNLTRLAATSAQAEWTDRIKQSASIWRACVIKQLRSDGDRPLAFQTSSAKTEINILSKKQFVQHPHIATLLGWALCLDSLEHPSSSAPRLPLLVLEKSRYDLRGFLDSNVYAYTSHQDLCAICFGIGRGLQALHGESISHGDLKPANILIFERDYTDIGVEPSWRWVPKLCDFGLATTFEETSQSSSPLRYRGTGGWKPPESYLKLRLKTFQYCDVFAYGLVVWCIFIGVSSSPICTRDQDEEATNIVANIGQQTYYHNAAHSIRRAYDLVNGVGPGPSKSRRPLRTRRRGYLMKPTETRETDINRVLTVLRESLNDDPARREHQPWSLMDMNVEIVGSVQDPAKYSVKPTSSAQGHLFFQDLTIPYSGTIRKLYLRKVKTAQRAQHIYYRRTRQISLALISFTSTWIPWLLPQKPKQQTYARIYSEFESRTRSREALERDSKPYSFEANGIDTFEHADGDPCHNLIYLYNLLRGEPDQTGTRSSDDYVLYSFARIRSRVKICCWRQHLRDSDPTDIDSSLGLVVQELAMDREKLLYVKVSCSKDLETLTWLCRGEVARTVMQKMQEEPNHLWGWLGIPDSDSKRLAAKMTLLLERGCNIGRLLPCGGYIRSPFSWYLESLSPEDSNTAITVCHQFRRVAAEEAATDYARFYLTGQSPDLRDDAILDDSEPRTTALHDAVMASNYDVVEYLVRTDFLVNVEDHTGSTALQLADRLTHHLFNDKKSTKRIRNNQIIALLGQSKAIASHRSHDRLLPIGWEEIKPNKTTSVVAGDQQMQADRTIPETQEQHEVAQIMPDKETKAASSAESLSRSATTSQSTAAVPTKPKVDDLTRDIGTQADYNPHDPTESRKSPPRRPRIPIEGTLPNIDDNSCYITIGGNVYDVMPFLSNHPGGGHRILEYRGRDVSKIMGNESSHQHSIAAYEKLDEYFSGVLPDPNVSTATLRHEAVEGTVFGQAKDEELLSSKERSQWTWDSATAEMPDVKVLTRRQTDRTTAPIKTPFLDLDKPLLMQLWAGGFSKEFYLSQVHRPRYYSGGGSAPLTGNFLEPLTKTTWWVVPFCWLLPVVYEIILAGRMLSLRQTAKYWLLGLVLWTLIEHTVHRFVFHCDRLLPDNRLAIVIHFVFHGLHHFLPMDKDRTARPPALSLILAAPLYLLIYVIFFWDFYIATAVASGATFGYICFEATHHFLHVKQLPPWYRDLKKRHMQHHYADCENGFGVTTRFWDKVFGTELELQYSRKEE